MQVTPQSGFYSRPERKDEHDEARRIAANIAKAAGATAQGPISVSGDLLIPLLDLLAALTFKGPNFRSVAFKCFGCNRFASRLPP